MALDRKMRLHASGHLGHDVGITIGELIDAVKDAVMVELAPVLAELRAARPT